MRSILLFLALFVVGLPAIATASPAGAAGEEPAIARTKALIAAFQKVKEGAPARANAAVFDELDGYIDFGTITAAALEPRKDKFTKAQRTQFDEMFTELIRGIAYPNSGGFFRDAEWKILPAAKKQGDVTIVTLDTRLPKEDLETEVGLHWKGAGKEMRIVDVSFDGDSLVADYRNQFMRIVDKEGSAGLVAKARAKLDELKQKQGKKE
jgi:ABC-type transporter MlaC component